MQNFVLSKHILFELNVYYNFDLVNENALIQNALLFRDLGCWIDFPTTKTV